MYLIHFHNKNNIKIRFPQSWVFSFKPNTSIHYPSQHGEINCVAKSSTQLEGGILKKNNNNYNIISIILV